MKKERISEILMKSRPFRYLTENQTALVQSFGQVIEYQNNRTILSQGKVGTGLYVVLSGNANVAIRKLGEETISLAQLESGNFFGEANLLNVTQCTATVSAGAGTVCFFLPKMCFDAFSIGSPGIRYLICRALAEDVIQRYRNLNAILAGLLTKQHDSKNQAITDDWGRASPSSDVLRGIPLLQHFDERELSELVKHTQLIQIHSKSCIIRQNQADPSCFLVINGAVLANIVSASKTSHFVVHPPHTLICPVSLIDKKDEIFSCHTCGPALLLELTADYLKQVEQNDLSLWYKCFDLFCRHIFSLQKNLNTQVTRLTVEQF